MSESDRILPEQALEKMEDEGYVYVDVRSINEYEGGHPEGAYNVPFKHMAPGGMAENADFLAVMQATFEHDTKLIVGCKAGGRSKAAAAILVSAGFTDVLDQRAGYVGSRDAFGQMEDEGWQTAGYPISIEPEEGRSYAELAAKAGKDAPQF